MGSQGVTDLHNTHKFPTIINALMGPVIYANETSALISIKHFDTFCSMSNFAYYLVSN
jgi:hypothetical protein